MRRQDTILIIDDSELTRITLQDALAEHGFRALTAANGQEGLARMNKEQPDVILMDVVMPIMDGWETCRQIRAAAHLKDIPVIIMTHKGTPADLLKAFEAGADEFLQKPIELPALLRAIELHRTHRDSEERRAAEPAA